MSFGACHIVIADSEVVLFQFTHECLPWRLDLKFGPKNRRIFIFGVLLETPCHQHCNLVSRPSPNQVPNQAPHLAQARPWCDGGRSQQLAQKINMPNACELRSFQISFTLVFLLTLGSNNFQVQHWLYIAPLQDAPALAEVSLATGLACGGDLSRIGFKGTVLSTNISNIYIYTYPRYYVYIYIRTYIHIHTYIIYRRFFKTGNHGSSAPSMTFAGRAALPRRQGGPPAGCCACYLMAIIWL